MCIPPAPQWARFGPRMSGPRHGRNWVRQRALLRRRLGAYGPAATAYGLSATPAAGVARCLSLAGGAQRVRQLAHAAGDPRVGLVEHVAALIDRIAHRPRLHRPGVEIPEQQDVARPAPVALTHETPLARVHDDDE